MNLTKKFNEELSLRQKEFKKTQAFQENLQDVEAFFLKKNEEHQILYKHGVDVLETEKAFFQWMAVELYSLDNRAPINVIYDDENGIKIIERELNAIEYGLGG